MVSVKPLYWLRVKYGTYVLRMIKEENTADYDTMFSQNRQESYFYPGAGSRRGLIGAVCDRQGGATYIFTPLPLPARHGT